MELLEKELDSLLAQLPNEREIRERLDTLVSIYPFNEYEFLISTLLAMDVLTLGGYHELRGEYIKRNRYLDIFEISAPRTFGESWAHDHLKELAPNLRKPSKKTDRDYDREFDLYLDEIRIEVKASRVVDANLKAPLYVKALYSDSEKTFRMNFQRIKPDCCDVFVWIAVWRDIIRYWVLSSNEVETNEHYSKGQHRGNVGEGQLHLRRDNIREFEGYRAQPNELEEAIRAAYNRQMTASA